MAIDIGAVSVRGNHDHEVIRQGMSYMRDRENSSMRDRDFSMQDRDFSMRVDSRDIPSSEGGRSRNGVNGVNAEGNGYLLVCLSSG
jgi:hypothetical protein